MAAAPYCSDTTVHILSHQEKLRRGMNIYILAAGFLKLAPKRIGFESSDDHGYRISSKFIKKCLLKVERNHNSSAPTFFFLLQSG
jgi:hypothetical protein